MEIVRLLRLMATRTASSDLLPNDKKTFITEFSLKQDPFQSSLRPWHGHRPASIGAVKTKNVDFTVSWWFKSLSQLVTGTDPQPLLQESKMACRLEAVGKPVEWLGMYLWLPQNNKSFYYFWVNKLVFIVSFAQNLSNIFNISKCDWFHCFEVIVFVFPTVIDFIVLKWLYLCCNTCS